MFQQGISPSLPHILFQHALLANTVRDKYDGSAASVDKERATAVKYLDFYKAFDRSPQHPSLSAAESWIWWVDGVVDEELIRHQEDSGHWLIVLKDIRDQRCPSGICFGTGVFNIW